MGRHGSAESVKSNEASKRKERKIEVTSEAKKDIEDLKRRSSVDSTTSQDSQRVKISNGDVDKKVKVEENGDNESSSDKKKKKKHKHKDKHKKKDKEKDKVRAGDVDSKRNSI